MMRVAVDVFGPVDAPYQYARDEDSLGLSLRDGFIEMGLRRSTISKVIREAGHLQLCTRHSEKWFRSADLQLLTIGVSRGALATADAPELRKVPNLADPRISALMAAVNAERVAGFPSGPLFLDSVEQALAAALVERYAVRRRSPVIHRGGLTPARLRKVTELVQTRLDGELRLEEMAASVDLSTAHFAHTFRESTGQSPHQFVLHQRIERAKEILRTAELRVLDVALACGFKTQQHFSRVFRQMCGISPTEYRHEYLR